MRTPGPNDLSRLCSAFTCWRFSWWRRRSGQHRIGQRLFDNPQSENGPRSRSGCLVLLAGAAIHLLAAYPRVPAALAKSNLNVGLQFALLAVFSSSGVTGS